MKKLEKNVELSVGKYYLYCQTGYDDNRWYFEVIDIDTIDGRIVTYHVKVHYFLFNGEKQDDIFVNQSWNKKCFLESGDEIHEFADFDEMVKEVLMETI